MKTFLQKLRRAMRRNESGQSIIVLAIGFIALVGFVGITTDVSLMFIRYSQLSRAVDAAAISAANQVRQDRTYANLGIAARQFIELYGLNPTSVLADTRGTVLPANCDGQPNEALKDELCKVDARNKKLVRVTAQIESPTVFMRLLGFPNFTLQASSVSETASLDVVVIMDVSESMASYTTVEDWATKGLGVIYRPPMLSLEVYYNKYPNVATRPIEKVFYEGGTSNTTTVSNANSIANTWQQFVNNRLYINDTGNDAAGQPLNVAGQVDTDYQVLFNKTFFNAEYGTQTHPRAACRVRYYPSSNNTRNFNEYWGYRDNANKFIELVDANVDTPVTFAQSLYGQVGLPWPNNNNRWDGFVPTYNFFGCCNDPRGAGNFAELICQPFKQARDATLQFMDRVDFGRGDRIAFVTFDRTAFLIEPLGDNSGMIQNANVARQTLTNLVGVRAEPNFYRFVPGTSTPTQTFASWNGFAAGVDNEGNSIPVNYTRVDTPVPDFNGYANASNTSGNIPPEINNYPTKGSCPFRVAALPRDDRTMFDFGVARSSQPNVNINAGWATYQDGIHKLYNGAVTDPRSYNSIQFSYDLFASCRGSNVGSGLREGIGALLNPNTTRQSGAVWVMILLANGAAGGSDPVRRNRAEQQVSLPYAWNTTGSGWFGVAGQYGAFGLCPYGTPTKPAEVALPANDSPDGVLAPLCADESPMTRSFCNFRPLYTLDGAPPDPLGDFYQNVETGLTCVPGSTNCGKVPATGGSGYKIFDPTAPRWYGTNGPQTAGDEAQWNQENNNTYDVDLQGCQGDGALYYDVDDYAHDWADYIAVRTEEDANVLLPTIFTIGFGTEFLNRTLAGTTYNINVQADAQIICQLNPSDCIGEQLLRYIADAGDNNRIDNDWYQAMLYPGAGGTTADINKYGRRDPCQRQDQAPVGDPNSSTATYERTAPFDGYLTSTEQAEQYGLLMAQRNCGNYYYAPDYNQLQFVFDDIASRVFTRLSR